MYTILVLGMLNWRISELESMIFIAIFTKGIMHEWMAECNMCSENWLYGGKTKQIVNNI